MRLRIGPNDEDAYCEIRDELVGQFSEWAEDLLLDVDPEGVVSLLDYKWAQGDGELTYWTEPDLEDFLVVWYPRNVATAAEGRPTLIATIRSFLDFLEEHDLFDERSDPTANLLAGLEDVEAHARPIEAERAREQADDTTGADGGPGAVGDVGEAGQGRNRLGGVDEQRVELLIDAAMQRWIEGLGGGGGVGLGLEGSGGLLGDELLGQLSAPRWPMALPPSRLELSKLAADAPIVRWFRELALHFDGGRSLTTKGALPAADVRQLVATLGLAAASEGSDGSSLVNGSRSKARVSGRFTGWPQLDHAIGWAERVGVLTIEGRDVRVDPTWSTTAPDPIDTVQRAFSALVEMGPLRSQHPGAEPTSVMGVIDQFIDDGLPHIVAMLHAAGRPMELARLVEPIAALAWDSFEFPHVEDVDTVQAKVSHALDELFGVLERAAIVQRDARTVGLTVCGSLVAPGLLTGAGYAIKFAGTLADKPPLEALVEAAEMDEDDAMAELLVWAEHRPPAVAAAELTQAALDAEDPSVRVLSMAALDFVADDAVEQVRGLLDSPLQGYAVVWLTHHGFAAKVDLDPEVPESAVEVLGTILEAGGPEALSATLGELGSTDAQRNLIEAVWRTRHPATLPVLEAVSHAHADDATAKAARKAAFRHRSWLATVG